LCCIMWAKRRRGCGKCAAVTSYIYPEEKIYDSGHGQTRRRRARPRIGVGFFVVRFDVSSTRRRVALWTGGGRAGRRADDGAEVQKHSGLERVARVANAP